MDVRASVSGCHSWFKWMSVGFEVSGLVSEWVQMSLFELVSGVLFFCVGVLSLHLSWYLGVYSSVVVF